MGRVHTEALRRLGNIEVVAVAGSSTGKARKFANEVYIDRATGDYRELLPDPEIEAENSLGLDEDRHNVDRQQRTMYFKLSKFWVGR
jgi:hypothetical protein